MPWNYIFLRHPTQSLESFWGLWQGKDDQSFPSFLVERIILGPSSSPSPVQPLLCKFCQIIREYSLSFFFPPPVFDFFHVRYLKGPNQPYLRSEKRKLCIWSVNIGEIKNCCVETQSLWKYPEVTLYFLQKAISRARNKKLICLSEFETTEQVAIIA